MKRPQFNGAGRHGVCCATFLYTSELISANPMPLVGHPKLAKTLPKALPLSSVEALLAAIASESEQRASDWTRRDRALILTSLLAGPRADELLRANIGDVRRSNSSHLRPVADPPPVAADITAALLTSRPAVRAPRRSPLGQQPDKGRAVCRRGRPVISGRSSGPSRHDNPTSQVVRYSRQALTLPPHLVAEAMSRPLEISDERAGPEMSTPLAHDHRTVLEAVA
jgi:integrase